jgi:hypothetical protein
VNDAVVHEGKVLQPSFFRVGDRVRLQVLEVSGEGLKKILFEDELQIQNAMPVIHRLRLGRSPRHPSLAETEIEYSDPDGNMVRVSYEWSVNGRVIEGADGPRFELSSVKRGDVVMVAATATDGVLETAPFHSDALRYANSPPEIHVASAARVKEQPDGTYVVTCALEIHEPDGDPWELRLSGETSGVRWTGSELSWEGGLPGQSRHVTVEVLDQSGEAVARDVILKI